MTKEERTQTALEEYKSQKFELLSIVTSCQAGQIMVETNTDKLQIKNETTIGNRRYLITAVYRKTLLSETPHNL